MELVAGEGLDERMARGPISPAEVRAMAAQIATPPGLAVYPVGTGVAKHLDPGPIVQFHATYWFPDSEHILIVGNEADGPVRCYRQAISGGVPEALAITGAVDFLRLAPDGTAVLGIAEDQGFYLFPLDGGPRRALPGLRAGDEIQSWNREGTAVYVAESIQVPQTLIRVDLETEERSAAFTFGPEREPGLLWLRMTVPVFDPADGYAYGYLKSLSRLFVVDGAGW